MSGTGYSGDSVDLPLVYILIFLQTELLIVLRQAFFHYCELHQVWEHPIITTPIYWC